MRFALLILVLVGPTLLSAASLPPWPWDIVRPVVHGQFVYVQLDEEARRSGKCRCPKLACEKSGLYRIGEPEHAVWTADLGMPVPFWDPSMLLVTDDGVNAVVLESRDLPHIRFFREGELIRSWRLRGPQHRSHRSETNMPGATTPFLELEQRDNLVVVTSRSNDQYTFIIQTGELVRRRYPSQLRPTTDELASFGAALAGGQGDDSESEQEPAAPDEGSVSPDLEEAWLKQIPDGAEITAAPDGRVKVVRILNLDPGGPSTTAYNHDGKELWSLEEFAPQPLFLTGAVMADSGEEVAGYEIPDAMYGKFPLLVHREGKSWAWAQRDGLRGVKLRLFHDGELDAHQIAPTYAGAELKVGPPELWGIDDEHFEIRYPVGYDWSETYTFDLGSGEAKHTTNFPAESDEESTPGHSSNQYGFLGQFWPVILIAFLILLLGVAIGYAVRRRT